MEPRAPLETETMTTTRPYAALLTLIARDAAAPRLEAALDALTPEALEAEATEAREDLVDFLERVVDTLDTARAAYRGIPEALNLRIAVRRKASELETWADDIGAFRRVETAQAQRIMGELDQARRELLAIQAEYRANPDPINTGRLAVIRGRVAGLIRDLAAWAR